MPVVVKTVAPYHFIWFLKAIVLVLAGMAQWAGVSSCNRNIVGQSTYPGCGFDPQSWSVQEATD